MRLRRSASSFIDTGATAWLAAPGPGPLLATTASAMLTPRGPCFHPTTRPALAPPWALRCIRATIESSSKGALALLYSRGRMIRQGSMQAAATTPATARLVTLLDRWPSSIAVTHRDVKVRQASTWLVGVGQEAGAILGSCFHRNEREVPGTWGDTPSNGMPRRQCTLVPWQIHHQQLTDECHGAVRGDITGKSYISHTRGQHKPPTQPQPHSTPPHAAALPPISAPSAPCHHHQHPYAMHARTVTRWVSVSTP
jgi:hypothetical protein